MQRIPLTAVPNQIINFNVDGAYWQLYFYAAIEHMCSSVSRNGVVLIEGVRCFGGIPLVPYDYLMIGFGNFIFNEDVDWENFGNSCQLYYLNEVEMQQFNSQIEAGYLS